MAQQAHHIRDIRISPVGSPGLFDIPREAYAIVAFAHGSGSSRFSPRNEAVANALNARGMATSLFDLLTPAEERNRANVFNISLPARRLLNVIDWLDSQPSLSALALGLFGASISAAAALAAVAQRPDRVRARVSRRGPPDLAGDALEKVCAPTLLIVGGLDLGVIELNEQALEPLPCSKALAIIPGAREKADPTSGHRSVT